METSPPNYDASQQDVEPWAQVCSEAFQDHKVDTNLSYGHESDSNDTVPENTTPPAGDEVVSPPPRLAPILSETPTQPIETPPIHFPIRPAPISAKLRAIQPLIVLYSFSFVFNLLYYFFIYVVLINRDVQTPGVYWDAVKTNYVVSVLSQISALLTDATIIALLGALRPALASRLHGSSFASWVGLGASAWTTVFQVAAVGFFVNVWCGLRLSLPLVNLAFGSILKFQAVFEYYFIPSNISMLVYSGLITPDLRVLDVTIIPAADIAMFFLTWSASLLTNSRFAIDFPMDGCDSASGACRSVMLPGSLGLARQVKPLLNTSVYFGDVFAKVDTIRIESAPGMIVKYEVPDFDLLDFNITTDCVYAGAEVNNGLQVCVKQDGPSMLVGWSACPKSLLDTKQCTSNSTWRLAPLTSATRMSLYTQRTSTSYDRQSQSILNISPLGGSPPLQIPLNATDYTRILSHILIPSSTATQSDRDNIHALIYSVTWMHRTFLKSFPDDKNSSVTNLHNVLAVPVQFAVNANIFANYTAAERGFDTVLKFPLPEELRTTATGGTASSRLKIQWWTGWVFISTSAAVHLAVLGCIAWIVAGKEALPGQTGVQELDDLRMASGRQGVGYVVDRRAKEEGGKWMNPFSWFRKSKTREVGDRRGDPPVYTEEMRKDVKRRETMQEFALDPRLVGDVPAWRLAWGYRKENVRVTVNRG
ncbi:hypothetical protein B0H63DRAFT_529483 [Podospora didyma]|uniref:Transmembrane protein n=1 Tax=Podospora didyma TaxID=330526 RepID=A0AAE0K1A0_9PEZI|nr:hypothetical protein B0H63DRAFT_529483 [Podospora didyma]